MLLIYWGLVGFLIVLLLLGTQLVSPSAVLGFHAVSNFDAAFVVVTAGMVLTLPAGLASGLYRARGLYRRAVRLQNWIMLLGQLGQLIAAVTTGSLLAVRCCDLQSVTMSTLIMLSCISLTAPIQ